MSYDIELVIDTGGEGPVSVTECISPTYNLAPMFFEALGCSLTLLRGMLAGDTTVRLDLAIFQIKTRPKHFEEFTPANGWGNYEGAVKTLEWMAAQARLHPKATWRI